VVRKVVYLGPDFACGVLTDERFRLVGFNTVCNKLVGELVSAFIIISTLLDRSGAAICWDILDQRFASMLRPCFG
jgi:hypothetical protein